MRYAIGIIVVGTLILGAFSIFPRESAPEETYALSEQESPHSAGTGILHSVVITNDGFKPSELTIERGDTVVFSAAEDYGKLYWPASNLHPSHLVYPEFDPREPIEPDEEWDFVFQKVGEWRFHDHLAPYYTGTLTVKETL